MQAVFFLSRFLRITLKPRLHYSSFINSEINNKINTKEANIIKSSLPEITVCDTSIPEYVFKDFGKYPHKIAVECGVTGKKYTYEEIRMKSINFANALQKKLKYRKGDVVALLLPNIPDFPICILGALQASLTVTTINPLYTPDEIKQQLIDADVKLLITLGQLWPIAQAAINLLPMVNKPTAITIKLMESETLPEGTINFQELTDFHSDINFKDKTKLHDLALLPYSSGTTGVPKGVELTSGTVLASLLQMHEPSIKLGFYTTDSHQDVVPAILPWFHIYGMVAILFNNLHLLCKVISLPKFSPDTYINMLEKHKPNIFYLVPPLVLFMSNSPLVQTKHLQSIHVICSGAAPLGALDEEKLQKKMGKEIDIVQGYGLTESCSVVFMLSPRTKQKLSVTGSIGEPLGSTSVKIMPTDDSFGKPLGPNNCGEIFIKGPQMFSRYHNKPQETKDTFIDGWFKSGDVGYYDDNKLFYITDRLKELIKVKGFQVAPAELEEIIRDYPGVSDAAVIGVPHDKYGEVPRAYIVTKPNVKVQGEKLQEYVASKASAYKHLKGGVYIVDNIPKTPSGKILKKDLKLLYEKEQQK